MQIWSLGTSNHTWTRFQQMLEQHQIGCVADVRTFPRSRLPCFNRPAMRVTLNRLGVSYIFLGDELGGRPRSGPDRYSDMAQTPAFLAGINTLLEIAPRTRLALVCSEAENCDCHRFLLVARHLSALEVEVTHIHRDGSLESQYDAEERLLARTKVKPDLLRSRDERLSEAYHRQEQRLRGEPA